MCLVCKFWVISILTYSTVLGLDGLEMANIVIINHSSVLSMDSLMLQQFLRLGIEKENALAYKLKKSVSRKKMDIW